MQFTIIFFYQQKRRAQKTGEGKETVGPEVPKRAEERREEREAQVRAKGNEGEHIEPQLTLADAQREGEKGGGEEETVERVEQVRQGAAGAFYGLRPASTALITAAGLVVVRETFWLTGGVLFWQGTVLAAVLLVLTRWVKQTKNWHPIVFIGLSALVGVVFRFAGA